VVARPFEEVLALIQLDRVVLSANYDPTLVGIVLG
jgi:hypothetical protein